MVIPGHAKPVLRNQWEAVALLNMFNEWRDANEKRAQGEIVFYGGFRISIVHHTVEMLIVFRLEGVSTPLRLDLSMFWFAVMPKPPQVGSAQTVRTSFRTSL